MLSTVTYAFLLPAPSADDMVLRVATGDANNPDFNFTSAWAEMGPKRGKISTTHTVTNHQTDTWLSYTFRAGDQGRLPKASKKDGKAGQRSMTAVRTTYRSLGQATDNIECSAVKAELGFEITANRWLEATPGPWAHWPYAPSEAKLIEGNEKGKVLNGT